MNNHSSASTGPAVSCERLVKTFGPAHALDGLDLEIAYGEVHGFLGPNGAGKTVTMRIVLGLLRPDSGLVRLLDGDPWKDAVRLHQRVAYVPGDTNLWPELTGGESIDVLGELRGGLDPVRRAELVDRFHLDPTKKARNYSKGNRQKVALIAALASDADLLILDEPTAGLDPLMEAVFQTCIAAARDQGRTVMLSSHILGQVERLCDRVTIIRRGRTVQSGTLDDLRHLTRTTITARLRRPADGLARSPEVHDLVVDGDEVTFGVDSEDLESVVSGLAELGVLALRSHPPTLEELFLRHYGDELHDAGISGGR